MMHRTHAGGLLAVALPGALTINPWLAVPVICWLGVTRCLTAWIAALVGLAVLFPEAAPFLALALPVVVWVRHRLRPGAIIDTTRARLISWLYICRELAWWGHGYGSARLALEAAHIRSGGRALEGGPVHNEWLELVYEYGLRAALPLVAVLAVAMWLFRPRDALTASLVTAAVVACGTSPVRAFSRWLRGDRGSLFGPPLKASLSIHIDHENNVYLYGNVQGMSVRDVQADTARALALTATALCKEHGISMEELMHAR